jgi:diacylglycerol kinase family enzyme
MNDDSSRNDDFEVADKGEWYDPVSRSTREVLLSSHDDANAWAIAITKWANPIVRSIHCIVNPTSGTGQARSVWEKLVEPLLRVTPHSVHVHYTQGPGDATTYCKEVTLEAGQSTVFAVVGGDGSMSEALNGLMHRTDAERGRFTVCFVPAGSSNAMAHMLGMGDPLTAAWALAKGRQQAMDLFAFHQGIWSADGFRPSRLTMYGFLSVTQGLVADIDIDSECMRCCGDVRYTAYTIGKLFCCCCCSICAPGHARTVYPSRIQWLTAESSAGEGTTQRILQDTKPQRGPVYNLDSPDHRQAWTGDLQFFNLLAAPAIDKKMHLSPGKRLDDAALHLQWMTPKCNLSLVGEFSRMEASTHLSSPGWADCKVVAVRVDGLDASSKVVVDGERVKDGESWQAEVLPSYVNVVVGSGPLISFGANNEQSQSESPSCRLPIPKSRVPSATL